MRIRALILSAAERARSNERRLSALLVVLIISLLVWRAARVWSVLPAGFLAGLDLPVLSLSLLALLPALLLVSMRWWLTLRVMDIPVGWWPCVRIWLLSQLGRHMPGAVWSYVWRLQLGRAELPTAKLLSSMALETGLRIVSELLVFLLSLPSFGASPGFLGRKELIALGGTVIIGLVIVHPTSLRQLGRIALFQKAGLDPAGLGRLRYASILALLGYYMATVVAVGSSFYLFVTAFWRIPVLLLPALTGSLAVSVVLGFLVPFVPGGWGVREGLLAGLLAQWMPLAVATLVALAARIWLMAGEGLLILVVLVVGALRIRSARSPKGSIDASESEWI